MQQVCSTHVQNCFHLLDRPSEGPKLHPEVLVYLQRAPINSAALILP